MGIDIYYSKPNENDSNKKFKSIVELVKMFRQTKITRVDNRLKMSRL